MKAPCAIACLLLAVLVQGCATSPEVDVTPESSYACQSAQVSGSPVQGTGQYGCHFYLHHPATKKILANTAYRLTIYSEPNVYGANPKQIVTLDGETDARGRSGYARADLPITPDRVEFVERIGSGPYGRTPRLIRSTDGQPVPGMHYDVTWCGAPYTGISDERGNGAYFATTNDHCAIKVTFYRKRSPG